MSARQTRSSNRLPSSDQNGLPLMASVTANGVRAAKAVASASAASRKRAPSGAVRSSPSPSPALVELPVDVKPPPKKRKTATKKTATTAQREPADIKPIVPTPYRYNGPNVYTPTLLPPTLSFSLPDAITHLTTHDPRFGSFFDNIPCKPFQPPLEAIDPFKTLVTSIIGQQVSWMAARAINKRFRELFGFEEEDGYPSPMQVSGEDVMKLKSVGLSLRKAEYVICLAQHFVDGRLSTELLRDGTDEEVSKALIAVRGIGQWTVDMFLMFSLRRPDVLPVGDLGVQKGLLRWLLAAHGQLPKSKSSKVTAEAKKKYGLDKTVAVKDEMDANGSGEIDTMAQGRATPPPPSKDLFPPTPLTPTNGSSSTTHLAALHTPAAASLPVLPGTPVTPGPSTSAASSVSIGLKPAETLETGPKALPPPAPETFLDPLPNHPAWNAHTAAPLSDGLTIDLLKSRLAGKKAKGGAYLTPAEMEVLTQGWKPYRSLAVYYMWPAGEEF